MRVVSAKHPIASEHQPVYLTLSAWYSTFSTHYQEGFDAQTCRCSPDPGFSHHFRDVDYYNDDLNSTPFRAHRSG